MIPEYKAKESLCKAAAYLAGRGLFRAGQGAISVRAEKNAFWVNPPDVHPAFLTTDKLLRVQLNGRVCGSGRLGRNVLDNMIRLYRQAPETYAVCVLAPFYIEAIRADYPELPPGSVDMELPLCDKAYAKKGILHEQHWMTWGVDMEQAVMYADAMDLNYHSQARVAAARPNKQEILQRIIGIVTEEMKGMR